VVADNLVRLYGESFGGRGSGKFRISRKFLRQIAARRHLSQGFLEELGEELYERGYAFVDLETYFAVIDQRQFNSYRRVTAVATELAVGAGDV
jgi:hypothetical protein